MAKPRVRRDGQPTVEELARRAGGDDSDIPLLPPGDDPPGGVDERQADARADSAPPGGATAASSDGEQLSNGHDKATAMADMAEVRELNQQISNLQMKVAGVYKRIEKSGGDRTAFKWAYKLRYGAPAQSSVQLEAFKTYCEWMVEPELEKASAELASSEG